MPQFSIGVTTYDRIELLLETLSSITAQTFSDYEVIVGNDNPGRILNAEILGIDDPRVKFVNHEVNLGEFNNMNSLLQVSCGRYFTWLADDDLYAPNFLSAVYEAIGKYDNPDCVFTSFRNFQGSIVPETEAVDSEYFRLLRGRDFLRSYLTDELKAIGVMGVFSIDYLRQLGGLEDVSGDGFGFYSEYMILVRSGLLKRIVYIDVPLVFYRVHQSAWGITNSDLEQYDRASENLIKRSAQILAMPELKSDFSLNLRQLLKRVLAQYVTVARRSETFRKSHLLAYFVHARKYVSSPGEPGLYMAGLKSLMWAEVWLVWQLCKQKFLSLAPSQIIRLAYFVQSTLYGKRGSRDELERHVTRKRSENVPRYD
jgi:glycosyltransferase involved in cell wall biosynthesis